MKSYKFDCLLVDPPWEYNNKKTGGTHKSGSVQKYETMTAPQILDLYEDLELDKIVEDDSCLFLWSTNSMLSDALLTMFMWGFTYKTMLTWVKPNYGMGFWYRSKTEHILFGVKGKVKPFRFNKPNVFYTQKPLKHSQKPQKSYIIVEQAAQMVSFDKDRRGTNILELFARKRHISANQTIRWECLGKEITGNSIEVDVQNLIALNTIPAE